jgi:O-antigen/teichoic acid export membrane protein
MIQRISGILAEREGLTGTYLKQLGGSVVVRVIGIVVTLLYIPMLLDFLNEEKYGIWVTLTTIINWIRLFDVGLGNGLRNKLSEAIALDKKVEARKLVSTTYVTLGSIFLSLIVVILVMNSFLDWNSILKTNTIPAGELRHLVAISVCFILVGFVLQIIVVVYAADGNSVMGGVMQLVSNVISLGLILLTKALAQKGDIIILAAIITGVPILVYFFYTIYAFSRKYRFMSPSFRYVDFRNSGDLLKLSWQFFIIQISAVIMYGSLPFIINRFYGPIQVTQYNIASTIFNLPMAVMALVIAPVGPLVTQAFARNDKSWIQAMLRKMIMVSFLICAGVLLLVLLSGVIYKVWIDDRVDIPFMLSAVVGFYAITYIINIPYSVFLNSTGAIRVTAILMPPSILLFIGGCYLYSWILNDVISIPLSMITINIAGLLIYPAVLRKTIQYD